MNSSKYKDKIASLPCVVCRHLGETGGAVSLHHVREGQGMGQRASDYLVVPLCFEHHQGPGGIHGLGTRGFEARYKLSELDLLAMTIKAAN